ncbi:MAG: FUSC family protein [Clostridia bacterium]|nr:FUSC family protein [Clostridia bacterium]
MIQTDKKFPLHVGQRNIKTAIAATLCALIYYLVDRNPTFACIGAIFGLGSDMSNSKLNGGNRFFGTLFGGVLGMLLFRIYIAFYPQAGHHPLLLVLLFVGVVVLILVSTLCKWPGAVQPGGVVLCILLFNTPVETYISYSVARIIDTGLGVLMALAVNWLLPRERLDRWLGRLGK